MTSEDGDSRRALGGTVLLLALVALSVGAAGTVAGADAATLVTGQVTAGQEAAGQVTAEQRVDAARVPVEGQASGGAGTFAVADPETDNTVTRIEVRADGGARWHVRVRTRLETEADVTAYEAYQERLRENRSAAVAAFRDRMRRVVAAAANVTEREMAATNFTVSTTIRPTPRRWGITTTSFTWQGFARPDGERLGVGDAFEGGYYIGPTETLQLVAPSGYEVTSVSPEADEREDRMATWIGRVDFGTGEPAATLAPADGAAGGAEGDGTGIAWLVLGLLAAVVALGVPAVWYRRRLAGRRASGGDRLATDGATHGGEASGAGSAASTDPAAPEPITDDERVQRLVREHGGRMKQADIVESVDWSKSKVSRVLGDLESEGVVERTRIGRENVVSLVEDGPAGSTSD